MSHPGNQKSRSASSSKVIFMGRWVGGADEATEEQGVRLSEAAELLTQVGVQTRRGRRNTWAQP